MAVYRAGSAISPGMKISNKSLMPGKEYIFEYQAPTIAFALLSPETLSELAKKWVSLRQYLTDEGGILLDINGVSIDTETGKIFVRGTITAPPSFQEAGINPWAVFAVIGTIFAVIGIGVSLMFVYEVSEELTGTGYSGPQIDPCSENGVIPYVRCHARRTGYVAIGIGGGVLLSLLFIVIVAARKGKI